MKKIAVLGAMFFIISPSIFAVEDCYFTWQLYRYYNGSNVLADSPENNGINSSLLNNYAAYFENSGYTENNLSIIFLFIAGMNEFLFTFEYQRQLEIYHQTKSLDPLEIRGRWY